MRRRSLLQLVGTLPVLPALDACVGRESEGFLDATERAYLAYLADLVLPPDAETPGGAQLGAVVYIDRLLSGGGLLYGSGPFSGRTPFPDERGLPSSGRPANEFERAEPLDRVQQAAWRELLFGDAGLRAQMRTGLALVKPGETRLDDLEPAFLELVARLVSEAAFAAPEYGGNPGGAGWRLCNYEGDAQPFGFANFDEVEGVYRERPESPVSTPNIGPDPDPLDDEIRALLDDAVSLLGGRSTR